VVVVFASYREVPNSNPEQDVNFLFDRDDNFGDEKIICSLIKKFLSASSPKNLEKNHSTKKKFYAITIRPKGKRALSFEYSNGFLVNHISKTLKSKQITHNSSST
jgi:hypothetical protein